MGTTYGMLGIGGWDKYSERKKPRSTRSRPRTSQ